MEATTARICAWGNSAAIRLPKDVLAHLGLSCGDEVVISPGKGAVEIGPKAQRHRCIRPMKGISYESLFAGYSPEGESALPASQSAPLTSPAQVMREAHPWPDDMVGAEAQAWG